MRPLEVVATMGEPVVYLEDGMHLDGILAFAAYRLHLRKGGEELPPINSPWAEDFDLPLAKWTAPLAEGCSVDPRLLTNRGEVWGWMASVAIADWLGRGKMEYRKKPDLSAMARYTDAKSHNIAAGPLKAFDVAYPTLFTREIRWAAIGDIEGVRELLEEVSHIGKKSTSGMGRVACWEVGEIKPAAFVRRMPEAGAPMGAIRPPYHHRSRRVPAMMREVAQ